MMASGDTSKRSRRAPSPMATRRRQRARSTVTARGTARDNDTAHVARASSAKGKVDRAQPQPFKFVVSLGTPPGRPHGATRMNSSRLAGNGGSSDVWVSIWHWALIGIAATNVVQWLSLRPSTLAATGNTSALSTSESALAGSCAVVYLYGVPWDYAWAQWALAGVYTAGCAYRSVLPRVCVERRVLLDHWASSIAAGRTAATLAEVALAAQVALLLAAVSSHLHALCECAPSAGVAASLAWIDGVAVILVPVIALAQVFCWYAVATLRHSGHVVEESLWATMGAAVGVCFALVLWLTSVFPGLPHDTSAQQSVHLQQVAWLGLGLCTLYVAFMVIVDVPMYYRRWKLHAGAVTTGTALSRYVYLGLWAGLWDALVTRRPSTSWSDWASEVPWLTGYFSAAVWVSLSLAMWQPPALGGLAPPTNTSQEVLLSGFGACFT